LAAKALGRIGADAKDTLPKLEAALKDRDARVRVSAALAVYQVDGRTAGLPVLQEALEDKQAHVREQTCAALAALGVRAAPADPGKLVDLVAAGLESENAGVRKRAAQVLGEFGAGAKAAVPALLQALRDRENTVREAAAAALRRIDPQAAAKAGVN